MVKVNRVSKKNRTSKKQYSRNLKKGGGTKTIVESSETLQNMMNSTNNNESILTFNFKNSERKHIQQLRKVIKRYILQHSKDEDIEKYLKLINYYFHLRTKKLELTKLSPIKVRDNEKIISVAFSHNCELIAIHTRNHLRLFNFKTSKFKELEDKNRNMQWSPDDKRIVTWGGVDDAYRYSLRVYDSYAGDLEWELNYDYPHRYRMIKSVAFSPDSNDIAIGTCGDSLKGNEYIGNQKLEIFDAKEANIKYHTALGCASEVVFSPDGQYIATADYFKEIKIIEPKKKKLIHTISTKGRALSLVFSPDSQYVVAAVDPYSRILKINVKTGEVLINKEIEVNGDYTLNAIYSLEFSPNGMKIAAVAELTRLFIIDAKTLKIEHVHKYNEPHGYSTSNLVFSFSPDSMYIAYSCSRSDGEGPSNVTIVDVITGKKLHSIDYKGKGAVAFSPDGRKIAIGNVIYDLNKGVDKVLDKDKDDNKNKYNKLDNYTLKHEDIGPILAIVDFLGGMEDLYEYLKYIYDPEEELVNSFRDEKFKKTEEIEDAAATKIQAVFKRIRNNRKARREDIKRELANNHRNITSKAFKEGLLSIPENKVTTLAYKNVINRPCNFTSKGKRKKSKDGRTLKCSKKGLFSSKKNLTNTKKDYCNRKGSYCWRKLSTLNKISRKIRKKFSRKSKKSKKLEKPNTNN